MSVLCGSILQAVRSMFAPVLPQMRITGLMLEKVLEIFLHLTKFLIWLLQVVELVLEDYIGTSGGGGAGGMLVGTHTTAAGIQFTATIGAGGTGQFGAASNARALLLP